MKITIESDPRNGYINYSMFGQKDSNQEDWTILHSIKNDSLDEISSFSAVNLICGNKVMLLDALNNWYKKLKHEGKVRLTFTNMKELGLMIKRGQLNLEQIHKTIFQFGKIGRFISIDSFRDLLKKTPYYVDMISIQDLSILVELRKL